MFHLPAKTTYASKGCVFSPRTPITSEGSSWDPEQISAVPMHWMSGPGSNFETCFWVDDQVYRGKNVGAFQPRINPQIFQWNKQKTRSLGSLIHENLSGLSVPFLEGFS